MKLPQKTEAIKSLAEMVEELNEAKGDTDAFLSDISEIGPDELDFTEDDELSEEEKGLVEKIKTPEDAKKVLKTSIDDLQRVSDSLDGLSGQVEEELTEAAIKRYSAKYAASLISLAEATDKVLADSKEAIAHWAFLKRARKVKPAAVTAAPASFDPIDQAFANMEKSLTFVEKFAKLLGYEKTKGQEVSGKEVDATAVPPTGADFSGDKFPQGKNTAEVENRAWAAGAGKFDRDVNWEGSKINPAVDQRLTTVDYPRNDAPYINASFKFNKDNKFSSYWEIVDPRAGKKVIADFVNVPADIGTKNEASFKLFSSKQYGKRILNEVTATGIDAVAKSLGGVVSAVDKDTLKVIAADKGSLKSYYTDAFGDSGYAAELTAGKDNAGMDVAYTPKDNSVANKSTETKDGVGKITDIKDPKQVTADEEHEVLMAKSRQAIMLARKFSSRGAIPFVVGAIMQKAEELMELDDEQFAATEDAIEDIPVTNEAALKSAHIPDTEVGIVGNTKEGVRDQAAKVVTEDINTNVKSDATVSKQASLVPQMLSDNPNEIKFKFNTVVSRLAKKGITPDKLRIAKTNK